MDKYWLHTLLLRKGKVAHVLKHHNMKIYAMEIHTVQASVLHHGDWSASHSYCFIHLWTEPPVHIQELSVGPRPGLREKYLNLLEIMPQSSSLFLLILLTDLISNRLFLCLKNHSKKMYGGMEVTSPLCIGLGAGQASVLLWMWG